jgi:hypothetical protein
VGRAGLTPSGGLSGRQFRIVAVTRNQFGFPIVALERNCRDSLGDGGPTGHPVPFRLVTISQPPIQYKGEDLDAERGPGLGCFRFQLGVLIFLIVLTPLTVLWGWPTWLSAALLFVVILLLLVAGQTIIFLLRLVAADRRGRRRPLASATKTVGELDDEAKAVAPPERGAVAPPERGLSVPPEPEPESETESPAPPSDEGPVRQ